MRKTFIYKVLRKIYHILIGKNKNKYKPLNKEKFIKKLLKYDIISFDIFDTLITRTIYNPDDVFLIIGEKLKIDNFLEKRKKAEQEARESLKKDVNLDEIYSFYKNKFHTNTNSIQKLEEDMEMQLCIPRKDMLEVLATLKKHHKHIIFTSDMYLKKTTIIKMLKKSGYKDYNELYISNEENARKDTKEIWPIILKKYPNKKIIHVGDNEKSDFLYPKEFGIETVKIENGKELFHRLNISIPTEQLINNKTSNSLLMGLIVNKTLFNSPFSTTEINSLRDFSYTFHGPIINSFLEYITESTNKEDVLLFLAREGYYLQRLYKEYCHNNNLKEIESVYFLASRKATMTANMSQKEDILKTLDNEFSGNISDFFKQIYEINYKDKDFQIKLPEDKEIVTREIEKYEKEILKATKNQKENYLEYISETIKDYKKKKLAIIDLGYSGTIQYQLTKMTDKEYNGYYLTNSTTVKRYSKNSKLSFLFDITENEEYKKIYHYSLILEYFLAAPFGQLIKFTKNGKKIEPVYNDDILDEKKKKTLGIIYQAVQEYMKDVTSFSEFSYQPDKELICLIYTSLVENDIITRRVKDYFDFIDYFCGSESKNVFKIIGRY